MAKIAKQQQQEQQQQPQQHSSCPRWLERKFGGVLKKKRFIERE